MQRAQRPVERQIRKAKLRLVRQLDIGNESISFYVGPSGSTAHGVQINQLSQGREIGQLVIAYESYFHFMEAVIHIAGDLDHTPAIKVRGGLGGRRHSRGGSESSSRS